MLQTQRIFSAMLDELVMDVTLQSHHESIRSKVVCFVCHTRYACLYPGTMITYLCSGCPVVDPVNVPCAIYLNLVLIKLQVHIPGSSTGGDANQVASGSTAHAPSRAATPSSAASNEFAAAKVSATGTSTPTGKDGNLYLPCVVCLRQVGLNFFFVLSAFLQFCL